MVFAFEHIQDQTVANREQGQSDQDVEPPLTALFRLYAAFGEKDDTRRARGV